MAIDRNAISGTIMKQSTGVIGSTDIVGAITKQNTGFIDIKPISGTITKNEMELRMICREGVNYEVVLGFPNTWDTFAMVLTLCHSGREAAVVYMRIFTCFGDPGPSPKSYFYS